MSNLLDIKFDSSSDSWSWDSSCNVTLNSVNVVFSASNSKRFAGYLVATEDAGLTRVLNVSSQNGNPSMTAYNTHLWAGYEVAGSSDTTNSVWESLATWNIPAANEPYTDACDNVTKSNCDLGVWTGLVNVAGGNGSGRYLLAQGGTESWLGCKTSGGVYKCASHYYLWYQFPNKENVSVRCSLNGIDSGDAISAYVLNQGETGANSSIYNLQVSDTTANKACTVSNFGFKMGVPHYAEFELEWPYGFRLPKFSSFTLTGNLYYSGSVRGMYTPYTNGWYNVYTMRNCLEPGSSPCYTDVTPGSVSSSNGFTLTWSSSSGRNL